MITDLFECLSFEVVEDGNVYLDVADNCDVDLQGLLSSEGGVAVTGLRSD